MSAVEQLEFYAQEEIEIVPLSVVPKTENLEATVPVAPIESEVAAPDSRQVIKDITVEPLGNAIYSREERILIANTYARQLRDLQNATQAVKATVGGYAYNRQDLDLVTLGQQKADDAMDFLWKVTRHNVRNFLYKRMPNEDDLQDVMSETYLRVLKGIKNFKGEASFHTYLFQIATNVANDFAERRNRHPTDSLEEIYESTLEDDMAFVISDVAFEAGTREEIRALVTRALGKLPESLRQVAVLRYIGGLTHQEIGEVIGISEDAAKERFKRANKVLKSDEDLLKAA